MNKIQLWRLRIFSLNVRTFSRKTCFWKFYRKLSRGKRCPLWLWGQSIRLFSCFSTERRKSSKDWKGLLGGWLRGIWWKMKGYGLGWRNSSSMIWRKALICWKSCLRTSRKIFSRNEEKKQSYLNLFEKIMESFHLIYVNWKIWFLFENAFK